MRCARVGIAAGTYQGTAAQTQTVAVQVGTTTVSNVDKVAEGVERAVTTLNDVLAGLLDNRDRAALEDTIRGAVASLAGAGVTGLAVSTEDGVLSLTLDRQTLERSLGAGDGDRSGPGATVEDLLDAFVQDVTTVTTSGAAAPAGGVAAGAFHVFPTPRWHDRRRTRRRRVS